MNNLSLPACLLFPLSTGNTHIPNHVLSLSPSLAVPHEGLVHLVLLDSWEWNAAASDGFLEAVATLQRFNTATAATPSNMSHTRSVFSRRILTVSIVRPLGVSVSIFDLVALKSK